jgi:hypothetical protein
MNRWIKAIGFTILAVIFIGESLAGASVGQALARSASKRFAQRTAFSSAQRLGPLHTFRKPVVLERFTRSPRLDKLKGLPLEKDSHHVFARRIHPGRKGSAEHIQKALNIPHPIKQRETFLAPAGTRYHERSVLGGQKGQREAIIEGRVSPLSIQVKERVILSHP